MANECINQLELEAAPERLAFLLRGLSPFEALERGELPFGAVPAIFELFTELAGSLAPSQPRFRLTRASLAVVFATSWKPPIDQVAAFAQRFPDVATRLSYAEPLEERFGQVVFEDGREAASTTYASDDEARAACLARGWDYELDLRLNTLLDAGALATANSRPFRGAAEARYEPPTGLDAPTEKAIQALHASLEALAPAEQRSLIRTFARSASRDDDELVIEFIEDLTCDARTGTDHEEWGSEGTRCQECRYTDIDEANRFYHADIFISDLIDAWDEADGTSTSAPAVAQRS